MAPRGNADIDRLGFTKWPPFVTFLTEQNSERNSVWRCWSIPQVSQWRESRSWSAPTILKRRMCPVQQVFPQAALNVLKQRLMKSENLWRLWLKPHNFDLSRDWAFFSLMTVSWTADWDLPVTSWQKLLCILFILHGVVHDQACWSWWKKKRQINSCQENAISVAIPISKGFLRSLQTEMCDTVTAVPLSMLFKA